MALRARNLKPGLFRNEILGQADPIYTIAFQGMWCLADRRGLLEDRPARIKAEIFPYRNVDIESIISWLCENDFIVRFSHGNTRVILVKKFREHQHPHPNEARSKFDVPESEILTMMSLNVITLVPHSHDKVCQLQSDSLILCTSDSLIPDPLIPEGSITPYGRNTTKARARGARKHPGGGHKLLDAETSPNRLQDALIARDAIIGMTPDEDASGRQIAANKSVLLDRLKTLLESRPDITPEMLVETWRLYLRTNPKYLKAPQYFFGSKNNQKSEYSANYEQYLLELQGPR